MPIRLRTNCKNTRSCILPTRWACSPYFRFQGCRRRPVADLGGGGHSPARAPPFEAFFYKCPPPPFLYMCPPFWNLKKKKKKKRCLIPPGYTPVATYPPPPPRRRWRSGKKSVGVPPPPPPEAGGGPKKTVCCAPPFLKFLDPPLAATLVLSNGWTPWSSFSRRFVYEMFEEEQNLVGQNVFRALEF